MSDIPLYPVTSDGYVVYGEIGRGAFAAVYQGKVVNTGEEVAIKIIDLDAFATNTTEIRREISTMSLLNHANIVPIRCSFVDHADLWIIMPLLAAGSCASVLKTLHPTGITDEALIATILYQTLSGLVYLHKDGRLHRDVKAGNILIGKHGEVQLADFGVAGTLMENGDRQKVRQTFTGTPCWMAPEVMEQTAGYTEKADIWSFGITALELAYGHAPYAKFQPMKVMLMTLQEEPPTAEIYSHFNQSSFSKHFHSMVSKCLKKDPTKRPSAKKLLEHKFFRLARDAQYVVDTVVKQMPTIEYTSPIEEFAKTRANTSPAADPATMPGSWVFDLDELAKVRSETQSSADDDMFGRRRPTALQNDNDDNESDDYNTPLQQTPKHAALQTNDQLINHETSLHSGDIRPANLGRFEVIDQSIYHPNESRSHSHHSHESSPMLGIHASSAPDQSTSFAQPSTPNPNDFQPASMTPTISHSVVGRFAVTDELHDDNFQ